MSDIKSFYTLNIQALGIQGLKESLQTVSDFQKAIDTLNQKIKDTPRGSDGYKLLKTELENVNKAYKDAILSQEISGKTAKEQERVLRDLTKAQKESEPNTDKWNEYTKAIAGASIKLEELKAKQKAAIDAEKLLLKPLALPNAPLPSVPLPKENAQKRDAESTAVLSPNFDSSHIETHRARLKALNEEYKNVDTKPERFKDVETEIKRTKAQIELLTKEQKESQLEFKRLTLPIASYEELSIRLVQLKHRYKQLTDEERESPFGKSLLNIITPLDKNIKQIDERLGVFNRHVGNYKGQLSGLFNNFSFGNNDIASQIQNIVETVTAGGVSIVGAAGLVGTAIAAMSLSITAGIEEASKGVQATAEMTKEEVESLVADLTKIKTTTNIVDLLGIGKGLGQLGIEVTAATIDAGDKIGLALKRDFGGNGEEAVKSISKIRNVFKDMKTDDAAGDLLRIGNAINVLSQKTEAEAPELVNYANRIGAIGGAFGVTGSQAIAIGATMQSLGIEAEKGAAGFNRVASEILANSDGFAKSFKVTNAVIDANRDKFNEAGKSAKTWKELVNTDIVGALAVLNDQLSKSGLKNTELTTKLKDLAITGEGEKAVFLSLATNVGKFTDNLNESNTAAKTNASILSESSIQIEGTISAWTRLKNNIGNSLIWNGLNHAIGAMLGGLADFIQQEPKVTESIGKEQAKFNSLIGTLTDSHASQNTVNATKKELLSLYPQYFKGVDMEKITQSQLNTILKEGNRQFEIRIANMAIQEDLTKAEMKLAKAQKDEFDAIQKAQTASTADRQTDTGDIIGGNEQEDLYAIAEDKKKIAESARTEIKKLLETRDALAKSEGATESGQISLKPLRSKLLAQANEEVEVKTKILKDAQVKYQNNKTDVLKAAMIQAEKDVDTAHNHVKKAQEALEKTKEPTINLGDDTKSDEKATKAAQRESVRRQRQLTIEEKAEYTYYESIKKFLDEVEKQKAKSQAAQIADEIERTKALERESTREKILTIEKRYEEIAKTENAARKKLEENIKDGTQKKSDLANFEDAAAKNRITVNAAKATELADIEKALQVKLYEIQRDGEAKRDRETKQRQKESFEIMTKHLDEQKQIIDTKSVKKIDEIRTEKTQKLDEFDNTHITDNAKEIIINKVARIELEATYEIKESNEKEQALKDKLDEINATIEAMNIDNDMSFRLDATLAFSPDVISKTKQQAADIQKAISDEHKKGTDLRQKYNIQEEQVEEQAKRDQNKKDKEHRKEALKAGFDIAEKFEATREKIANQNAEREKNDRVKKVEDEYKQRIALVGGNKVEEERLNKELAVKKDEIDLEFRRKQQDRDVKSALINAALSITKVYATMTDVFSATVAAVGIGVATAFQIAEIKKQKFKFGGDLGIDISEAQAYQPSQVLQPLKLGKVVGRSHEEGGVPTKAGELEGGEWIDHDGNGRMVAIKKEAVQKHEKLLSYMVGTKFDGKRDVLSAINVDGGGKPFGNQRSDVKTTTNWASDFAKKQSEMFKPVYPFIPQAAQYVTVINQQQAAPQNVTANFTDQNMSKLSAYITNAVEQGIQRGIMKAEKERRKEERTRKQV